MPVLNMQTPGVYVDEISAFPNSVVPVPTAIPAFIGYTARASYEGKSLHNTPTKISSMQEYLMMFGVVTPATSTTPSSVAQASDQYKPQYHISVAATAPGDVEIDGHSYNITADNSTIYYLYSAMQLFFLNGGSNAYIVSVGEFGKAAGSASKGDALINPNVQIADLEAGLKALAMAPEPTIVVSPDSMLLNAANNATYMQQALAQCGKLKNRIALFDILGGDDPDHYMWHQKNIEPFRTNVGQQDLNYGAAYFPYLKTSVIQDNEIDFNTLGGAQALAKLPCFPKGSNAATLLAQLAKPVPGGPPPHALDQALVGASSAYAQLRKAVLEKINTLPAASSLAGVYTAVDHTQGVWKAPANVSLDSVMGTTVAISNDQQADLNVDALTGKSINAIRVFPGKGTLVWGARTLEGNSGDWRYTSVRRTMIMIEQSLELALAEYVFAENDESTWATIDAEVSNFLTGLWAQGALVGPTAAESFSVAVGLNKSMTALDITNGKLIIIVKVAINHPVEFIEIKISQEMQKG